MARTSLRAEGDDRRRSERVDDGDERGPQPAQRVERRKATIRETEQVELSHPEAIGRAGRLLRARRGERRPGGNPGEVPDPLRAVGRDHEMGLASLTGEPGEQGAYDSLVVGMGEDGDERTPGLRVRRKGDGRGQRRGGDEVDSDAHAIQCSVTPRCARPPFGITIALVPRVASAARGADRNLVPRMNTPRSGDAFPPVPTLDSEPASPQAMAAEARRIHAESVRYWSAYPLDSFFGRPAPEVWAPADQVRHLTKAIRAVNQGLRLPRVVLLVLFGPSRRSRSFEALVADYKAAL